MSSFRLHSGDSEFNNRVDALFNSLQTVAVDLQDTDDAQSQSKTSHGSKRPHEDDDDGDAEFCKPQGLPPWRGRGRGAGPRGSGRKFGPRNSTPDYIKNPRNWTRYNMKDTKVLSDRENKREGLKLFHDLKTRRKQDEMTEAEDMDTAEHDKIVFKKPTKPVVNEPELSEESEKPDVSPDALFGGTQKIRLQEYEVGKNKSKSKRKSKKPHGEDKDAAKDTAKEVKLGHLMFEDEDE